uniref:Uncharacterized protein n=1 Tax=Tanacetum cinerariifolium TaxID=118510 RepID=A0A6L2JBB9_TANCI|nr:hypothetical protein [Tanacetum cinerariifolium]
MSTSNTHQQSLADAGSETIPLMLERVVNASRAKKLEKSHDPRALVAYTSSSSRTTTPCYVTHPPSVVNYDDDYQGDAVQNKYEDPLTSTMILLAQAITQRFSNPTNNCLRTISNTINQEIVQEEIIKGNNVQNDAGNIQRTLRTTSFETAANVQCYNFSEKAKQDEAGVILTDEHDDFLFADASRMEEIEELSANICLMARIQPSNFESNEGPSYDFSFLSEVQTPSTSYVNPVFVKDAQEQNGNVEYDNNVQESYALEQLSRNAYMEAEKQQKFA